MYFLYALSLQCCSKSLLCCGATVPSKQFNLHHNFTDSVLVFRLHYQVCECNPKSENTENTKEERLILLPWYFSFTDTWLKKWFPQGKLRRCLKWVFISLFLKPENCGSRNPKGNWRLSHSLETIVLLGTHKYYLGVFIKICLLSLYIHL